MVSVTGPIQITSLAQYHQLQHAALESTVLNPDLQGLADVINDNSGKYSDSDKLKAYLEEYKGYAALNGKATSAEGAQEQRFRYEIQGSSIATAISDAEHKVFQWQRVSDWSDETARAQLWASLSDVQKQLPQVQLWKPADAASAAVGASTSTDDPVTISGGAQQLFRGKGSPINVQQLSGAQWDALAEDAVHNTTLAPGLQRFADIINDATGQYSDTDKVSAYTQAYNAYTSLLTTQESGVTQEQWQQYTKFQETIANSDIGKAAAEGSSKLAAYESSHAGIEGDQRGEFFNSLSALAKQLPEFKNLGTSLADLMKQNTVGDIKAYLQKSDALLREAQLLFGVNPASNPGETPKASVTPATRLLEVTA